MRATSNDPQPGESAIRSSAYPCIPNVHICRNPSIAGFIQAGSANSCASSSASTGAMPPSSIFEPFSPYASIDRGDRRVAVGCIPHGVDVGTIHRRPSRGPRHVGHRTARHHGEHALRSEGRRGECVGTAGRDADGGEAIDRQPIGDEEEVVDRIVDRAAGTGIGQSVPRPVDTDDPQPGVGGRAIEPQGLEPAARAPVTPQHRRPSGSPNSAAPIDRPPPASNRRSTAPT